MIKAVVLFFTFSFALSINSQNCVSGDCNNGYGIIKMPDNSIRHGFFYNKGTGVGIDINYIGKNILYTVYEKNRVAKPAIFEFIDFTQNRSKMIVNIKSGYGLFFNSDKSKISKVHIGYDGKTKNLGVIEKTGQTTGCIAGNCKNGFGVYKFSEGTLYIGEFKNNNKNGVGFEKYSNGEEYYGEFYNNNRNGYGIYNWAPNATLKISKYIGQWNINKMEGKGVYYFGKHKFNAGIYKNDKLVEIITTAK